MQNQPAHYRFETLEPADWTALMPKARSFPSGHVFFREGETSQTSSHLIYAICSGKVDIVSSGTGGRVPIIRTLEAGEFFGLVGFLATNFHTATCTASGVTSAVVLSGEDLESLQKSEPGTHTRLLWGCARQLAKDLRACNQRLLAAMDRLQRPAR